MRLTDDPDGLVPVPTVADLVFQGLADPLARDKSGVVTVARVGAKGHDLMGKAMLENGRRMREHDAARRNVSRETPRLAVAPTDDPWPAWE